MARKPSKSVNARCPKPEHDGSHVTARGARQTEKGVSQRFRCTPAIGNPHYFTAIVDTATAKPKPPAPPAPSCPEHPQSRTVRAGTYGVAQTRQRYRCYPDPDDDSNNHAFTPKLARLHVHGEAEKCPVCDTSKDIHHGELVVARGYEWTAQDVVEGLKKLAVGGTYARVSREAIRGSQRIRTRSDKKDKPKERSYGSRASRNAWQIAAGWVEVFAPILWTSMEAELKQNENAPNIAGQPKVLLLDTLPIYRKRSMKGTAGGIQDWHVLVASQIEYTAGGRLVKLRLVRASATDTSEAWRLLLNELGYTPDYVLADAGSALQKAVREHYGDSTTTIPSLYHVRNAVEKGLHRTAGAEGEDGNVHPLLVAHLSGLKRYQLVAMTPKSWGLWWDGLEATLTQIGSPVEPIRVLRKRYEPLILDLLPVLREHPELPWSTGGFEVALRERIKPLISGRSHAFGNVERTNRLFDLAVCYDHGMFDDLNKVVGLIRADNEQFYGWATPQRAVADTRLIVGADEDGVAVTKTYSSLRDQQLVVRRAKKEGLA